MKKTTVQLFCDKCGAEIMDTPAMHYVADERRTFGNDCWVSCVDVVLTFRRYGESDFKENILCNNCKIEALEEVLKELKAKKEQSEWPRSLPPRRERLPL